MTEITLPNPVVAPTGAHAGAPAATTTTTTFGPTRAPERIELLDVLRGFALFGILQTNFSDWGRGLQEQLILFFVDGSFYTSYSFLFGLGFAIQMMRAEEAGRPFVARYLWRSTLLYAIAVIHGGFIWRGDILHVYAPMSLALLAIRRWRAGALLLVASVVLAVCMVNQTQMLTPATILYRPPPEASDLARVAQLVDEQRHMSSVLSLLNGGIGNYDAAGYRQRVEGRLETIAIELVDPFAYLRRWGDVFFMFVLGLLVGRRRIAREPSAHRRLLLVTALGGAVLGVLGNFYNNFADVAHEHGLMPDVLGTWADGLTYDVGNIALALCYLSTLTLLFTYRERARRFLAPLAYAGRMGLTNYLMQSVVWSVVLWRPGLGLDDALSPWHQQLALTTFFLGQLLYSRWWFGRFQFGPVEWAWRSLTWLRPQPMRRGDRS